MLNLRRAPSYPELEIKIEELALELARVNARLEALEASRVAEHPVSLDEANSARKIMACIGRATGNTASPDTAHLPVRNSLLKSPAFAEVRAALAEKGQNAITANEPVLRWLAAKSTIEPSETRYELVLRGAYTMRQLAKAERA